MDKMMKKKSRLTQPIGLLEIASSYYFTHMILNLASSLCLFRVEILWLSCLALDISAVVLIHLDIIKWCNMVDVFAGPFYV